MNFKEASLELMEGKKIRRRGWEASFYLVMQNCEIKGYRQEAIPFSYELNIIPSADWVIVGEEDGEQYIFADAIMSLLENKKIKLKEWPKDCYLQSTSNGRELFMRRICEHPFIPTFECFTSTDWEITE